MTGQETYEMVQNGTMTFEEFMVWLADQKYQSYEEALSDNELEGFTDSRDME